MYWHLQLPRRSDGVSLSSFVYRIHKFTSDAILPQAKLQRWKKFAWSRSKVLVMSGCKNFYRILGLEKTASEADIKKAYRSLALIHHPDKGGDSEKFKEINQAYEALNPPKKEALNPSNSISAQKSRMEQAKAQRKKDAQEAQAFLEARAAARAEKAAEARKAAKAAWQGWAIKGQQWDTWKQTQKGFSTSITPCSRWPRGSKGTCCSKGE